ncbi:pterin-4-alpha-carbinolamine dehydratase [Candidatus Nomurabacteria bacterium RIFCSPLOWO2_01_FULL_41_12]|uniref:Putative pterin-4-alpha-carbinolamine dehydratase n=1 Tax=Candidatus Nomurabacteria bacterium RIFCSPLOWO2_01_FULL_41_12 TaxID=1801774 RepID=A0A1F6WVF2_9BACT|nr:MAG: pterin-4-alpha-carbinolamine dehydratase [Candidatus Nomurabacteria bacterium RIFCSPLOWO2_01_FULL_41_12]
MYLLKKKCVPCEGGAEPLTKGEAIDYMAEVPGWSLSEDIKKISKEYKFKDFIGAINFVERVADVAEMEDHHPDIHIHYNKVLLELWTHAIGGLSENDFIVAAKVDAMK